MSVPMKILMLSDVAFPRVNGVSTSIQTFRRDLQARGHRCVLVAPAYPGHTGSDDADVLRVSSRGVPRDPEDRFMSRAAIRALRPQLRAAAFDLIHVQTPFVAHYAGVALAREFAIPVIETYHTYFEHYLHHYVPALPASWMRALARRFTLSQCASVATVISPSRPMADALGAYGVRTPLEILPTGLDASRFGVADGARFRARHGIALQRPMALFVGRVAHEKNIDFLLSMFVQVRATRSDALLVIAGEGPAREHCEQLAIRLGIQSSVRFIGNLQRDSELLDCYRAADVFVFASRTETQGLVLLEALAQGTPVVSTAVMGTADVLAGTHGTVVVDEHEDRIAAGVLCVLADAEKRAELSVAATLDAARWSSAAMAGRLIRLYRRVIENSSTSHRNILIPLDTTARVKPLAATRRLG